MQYEDRQLVLVERTKREDCTNKAEQMEIFPDMNIVHLERPWWRCLMQCRQPRGATRSRNGDLLLLINDRGTLVDVVALGIAHIVSERL